MDVLSPLQQRVILVIFLSILACIIFDPDIVFAIDEQNSSADQEIVYCNDENNGHFSSDVSFAYHGEKTAETKELSVVSISVQIRNEYTNSDYVNFELTPYIQLDQGKKRVLSEEEQRALISDMYVSYNPSAMNPAEDENKDQTLQIPLHLAKLYPHESIQISADILLRNDCQETVKEMVQRTIWQITATARNEHPHISLVLDERTVPKNGKYYQPGEMPIIEYKFVNDGNVTFDRLVFDTRVIQAKDRDIRGHNGVTDAHSLYDDPLKPGREAKAADSIIVNSYDVRRGEIHFYITFHAHCVNPDITEEFTGSYEYVIKTGGSAEGETEEETDKEGANLSDEETTASEIEETFEPQVEEMQSGRIVLIAGLAAGGTAVFLFVLVWLRRKTGKKDHS